MQLTISSANGVQEVSRFDFADPCSCDTVLSFQSYQVFSDWLTQTIRLYENQNFIEVSFTVGPIPFQDGLGREVVSVWSTGIDSLVYVWDHRVDHCHVDLMVNQTWYTDANGRDMQQRRFNYRPTWHLIVTDPFVH